MKRFSEWLSLREMASFSVPSGEGLLLPCGALKIPGMPCKDKVVGAIDMRFEGPPVYDPPFDKFNQGSEFIAKLPGGFSNLYLVYHGMNKLVQILPDKEAETLNYPKVPDYWFDRAQIYDTEYEVIKPALGDFNGSRQAAGLHDK